MGIRRSERWLVVDQELIGVGCTAKTIVVEGNASICRQNLSIDWCDVIGDLERCRGAVGTFAAADMAGLDAVGVFTLEETRHTPRYLIGAVRRGCHLIGEGAITAHIIDFDRVRRG